MVGGPQRVCLRYLNGVLRSGSGARIDAEDALQEAVLDPYERWDEIDGASDEEDRKRRVYRLLRDAASEALRSEQPSGSSRAAWSSAQKNNVG